MKRIFRVAPDAAEITTGCSYKTARPSCKRGLSLYGFEYLGNNHKTRTVGRASVPASKNTHELAVTEARPPKKITNDAVKTFLAARGMLVLMNLIYV